MPEVKVLCDVFEDCLEVGCNLGVTVWDKGGYYNATSSKEVHAQSISEENWLQYFHNLHLNEPLNPTQQNICNELRQNKCHGQHSRPLDFIVTEREIRKLKLRKS